MTTLTFTLLSLVIAAYAAVAGSAGQVAAQAVAVAGTLSTTVVGFHHNHIDLFLPQELLLSAVVIVVVARIS